MVSELFELFLSGTGIRALFGAEFGRSVTELRSKLDSRLAILNTRTVNCLRMAPSRSLIRRLDDAIELNDPVWVHSTVRVGALVVLMVRKEFLAGLAEDESPDSWRLLGAPAWPARRNGPHLFSVNGEHSSSIQKPADGLWQTNCWEERRFLQGRWRICLLLEWSAVIRTGIRLFHLVNQTSSLLNNFKMSL